MNIHGSSSWALLLCYRLWSWLTKAILLVKLIKKLEADASMVLSYASLFTRDGKRSPICSKRTLTSR